MSKLKLPKLGGIRRNPKGGGMCIVCGQNKAESWVDVQVTWFRGDDDVYHIHKDCYKLIVKREGQNLADYLKIRREEIKR